MKVEQALIAVGGRASRLRAAGIEVPTTKSFLVFENKPLLAWCLTSLCLAGVKRIVLAGNEQTHLTQAQEAVNNLPFHFDEAAYFQDDGLGVHEIPYHTRHLLNEVGHSIQLLTILVQPQQIECIICEFTSPFGLVAKASGGMQQRAGLFFYNFHLVFAGLVVVGFLTLFSALVTVIGSNSILDSRSSSSASLMDDSGVSVDSPNIVTTGADWLTNGARRALLGAGIAFYGACRSITSAVSQAGRATAHAGTMIVGGAWHGATFIGHGIGSSVMATLRFPGTIAGFATRGHPVSSIIRPADDTRVPVIDSRTSAAALAHLTTQQQQQISQLLADQLAANQGLGGSILAGDPNHGGYPAKWDNARQDSATDSWGMYNRECVSYAAWKVYQTYGSMPYWGGVGNANEWPRDARRDGIPTGSTPQAHSVAISMQGYYGHAMWVEKVSGNMIYVSQYNYDMHGHYSEMWLNGSGLTYIYFK